MEDVGVAGPPCRLQLYPDSKRQARASEKPAQSNKTLWGPVAPRREVPYPRGPEPRAGCGKLWGCFCTASRLARELRTDVCGINFGARKSKPRRLEPFVVYSNESNLPYLTCLLGKEDGETYYASKPLFESPTAVRLLKVAKTLQAAYSRMVLLRFVPLPCRVGLTLSDDIFFKGTAVTDGQAEVSVEFGQRIGLLPTKIVKDKISFAAWQFRAVLPLTNGNTAICKRMLTVVRASPRVGGSPGLPGPLPR